MNRKEDQLMEEFKQQKEDNPGKRLEIYPTDSDSKIGVCMANVIANKNSNMPSQEFAVQNPDSKNIEVHIPRESLVLKAKRGTNQYQVKHELGSIDRDDRPKNKK